MSDSRPTAGLLVTCLVDLFRPAIAEAAVELLEGAGYRVVVPGQGCCGQPNFSGGDPDGARAMALRMIAVFAECGPVIAPSGSCVAMVREYPALFAAGSAERSRAEDLAARTFELTEFLDRHGVTPGPPAAMRGRAAYHDSCSALRLLGIRAQPRALLSGVEGLELCELDGAQECCGFGGLFCVAYPEVSAHIVDQKIDAILQSGAECVIGGDLGCLLHIEGRLRRRDVALPVVHVAEVLAGGRTGGDGDGG